MKKIFIILLLGNIIIVSTIIYLTKNQAKETHLEKLKLTLAIAHIPGVDHTKFEILQKPFASPQAVTEACLSCHTERGAEFMHTSHWTWLRTEYIEGRGIVEIGKKNILNNYCIGIGDNELSCNKCHAGFGWSDTTFDFTKQKNIDCMVCHDNSGEYFKASGGAGYPDKSVNLNTVATQVGLPQKQNCGYCHFYGGGGNNVKHGDLEEAQLDCSREVDVHMSHEGTNLSCIDCHKTKNHNIPGKLYSVSSTNTNRVRCSDCHTHTPHTNANAKLNEHTIKVACQTCHIPTYAKVNPTKMSWDWSTAGKLKDGKPYEEIDSAGNQLYTSEKGTFTWGQNMEPEYVWFNGTANHYIHGDSVDTLYAIQMNTLYGSYQDFASQITPVKVHRANQLFDPILGNIIQPNLYDKTPGRGALWLDYDFQTASYTGMKYLNQAYSGKFSFAKTESYWPLNHQVAPKEQALQCTDCHSKQGRLAALTDFYMPGRDSNASVDFLGKMLILISLFGVVAHGLARIILFKKP